MESSARRIALSSHHAHGARYGIVALLLGGALLLAGCATGRDGGVPAARAPTYAPAFAEAAQRARADATLGGQARTDNARQIERLLSGLDDATLVRDAAALPAGEPLYNFAGRALLRRGLPLPRPFDRGAWHFDAGARPPADADGYRPPLKLAVLLPLSGRLAATAAPVRDGLLAGYYGERRRRPDLTFYDTAGTPAGALAAYGQAAAAGNDFVLGPLGRDEVGALFRHPDLAVPMLALNRGAVAPPAGSASFSLSPEDDGIAAAEFLLDRNALRILVITGGDDGMRRATAALRERLGERGSQVVASLDVAEPVGDLTQRLQAAARGPGGIDAVFLAVKAPQARALAPQLGASGLSGAVRVGTSQLAAGSGKPAEDRVLDGIVVPSEAWSVHGLPGLPTAAELGAQLKTARGPAARLFAFGFDAWQLTAYLEHLALDGNAVVRGATGRLHLDGFGNVLRTPAWSRFSGGLPVPLADGAR
jgi:outer membrane PBP1 activator LpoA protein